MDPSTLEKLWNLVKDLVGVFGVPTIVIVMGWWVLIRERDKSEKSIQKVREEAAATLKEKRLEYAAVLKEERDAREREAQRHRDEKARDDERHRYETQRWIDMAIQNNVIAMRNATNVDRAADVAEKVVQTVAPPSQQTPL